MTIELTSMGSFFVQLIILKRGLKIVYFPNMLHVILVVQRYKVKWWLS